jgi:predicted DCC family thiol-disulfide oxidoreductase YuxK
MRSPRQLFDAVYERQVSAVPLALFRIAFAVVNLLEVENLLDLRAFIFDPVPGVDRAHWGITAGLVAWGIALVALLVGFRTRLAAVANYVFSVGFLGYFAMSNGHDWHLDSGNLTGALLLVFAPSAAALSVDRLLARGRAAAARAPEPAPATVSFIYTVFLVLAVGLIYWDSMLWKLTSPMYLAGLGFWLPASLPQNTYFDLSPLLGPELLMRAMGYCVLLFEGLFLFLVWFRPLRLPLILAGVGFHVGIMIAYPIPLFSLQMTAFYIGMVPPSVYEAVARRLRRRSPLVAVYYDAMCPRCRRTAAILTALDVRRAVRWLPFQDHAAAEPALAGVGEARLIRQMHAVTADRRVVAGVAAYVSIFRAMGWASPLGWALAVPPVKQVASAVHDAIAARRQRDGGFSDDVSEIPVATRHDAEPAYGIPFVPARLATAGLLALWLGSVGIIALVSPLARKHLPFEPALITRVQNLAALYKWLVYPVTGFSQHGVFMDNHFRPYTSELMVVMRRGDTETVLPFIGADGVAGPYNWGRSWVHWTFRTADPRLPKERMEPNLARWIAYWAHREGVDLTGAEFLLRRRAVEVSLDRWQPDMGARNHSKPWWTVGRLTGTPRALEVEWLADSSLARPALARQ